MGDRELIYRFGVVGLIVGAVGLAATVVGQSNLALPLLGLAWWLSLILVIRPYVYERFGKKTGDWTIVILILGPFAIFAAPILWWEHRDLDPGE